LANRAPESASFIHKLKEAERASAAKSYKERERERERAFSRQLSLRIDDKKKEKQHITANGKTGKLLM